MLSIVLSLIIGHRVPSTKSKYQLQRGGSGSNHRQLTRFDKFATMDPRSTGFFIIFTKTSPDEW